jgi:hypothetical protein
MLAEPFVQGDRKMLFVLGHMRAGSSLLTHILCSHPNVIGYGETQNVYCTPEDFGATALKVYRKTGQRPDHTSYLLDKVLHEWKIARSGILGLPSVRIVFILRKPEEALSSLIQSLDYIQEPEQAVDHYEAQLQWVREVARSTDSQRWTYVTYAELTQNTEAVFNRLERKLNLTTPLSERYETTRHTGEAGTGDIGPHIAAGRIKRNIKRQMDERMRPYLRSASREFRRCLQTLERLSSDAPCKNLNS